MITGRVNQVERQRKSHGLDRWKGVQKSESCPNIRTANRQTVLHDRSSNLRIIQRAALIGVGAEPHADKITQIVRKRPSDYLSEKSDHNAVKRFTSQEIKFRTKNGNFQKIKNLVGKRLFDDYTEMEARDSDFQPVPSSFRKFIQSYV